MKLYIVLWKGTFDKKWSVDGIYEDQVIAEARLRLEELERPDLEARSGCCGSSG